MRKSRNAHSVRGGQQRPNLEVLEARALLTSAASNVAPPSQTFSVLTQDLPFSATLSIPSSLQAGDSYTIRQLVGYYDTYYNSTQDWTIDLSASTYTLSNISEEFAGTEWAGRNENQNGVGDLDLYPTSYTGIGKLVFAGPAGSYATITCSNVNLSSGGSIPLDRIFHVQSGASLGLQNVTVEGGMALDDGNGQDTDAEGGAVLVDSGASLSLVNAKIVGNFAIGGAGQNVVGATGSSRKGAGYNASGGGIYGEAGSNISIDATTIVSNNFAQGGRGGNVSGGGLTQGGQGGSAFGGGIAVDAPSSLSAQVVSNVATQLTIDSGATLSNNGLNQYTSSGNLFNQGGTGGSDAGGKGGSGGNAYGAGLYMGTGQLNLNGGSSHAPLVFSGNSEYAGPGFSTGTSGSNAGANGLADGAGATLSPGLVVVTNGPTSGGILRFSNNTVAGASNPGLYLPTVTTAIDPGSTSPNGAWNLRTAVAAVNPLVATGMAVTLNLPAATLALVSSTSGTNTGSLAVSNSGSGSLKIVGAGPASTIINAAGLGASAFSFSGAAVVLSGLQITGANISGNGGAINSLNSTVKVSNASLIANSVSTSTGEGGGIYQSGGSLSLVNTKLANNQAASGGGVFIDSNSTFSMSGGSASGNSAHGSGGGVYTQNAPATLSGVLFSQNSATTGAGGAVYENAGSLTVENDSVFQNNSAGTNGGAILVGGTGAFTMDGGSILANTAGQSGGGLAAAGASAVLNTVNVSGNLGSSSAGYGGGLYQSGGAVKLKNSTVQNNRAFQGAGIAVGGGTLKVAGGGITGNAAQGSGNGGGLMAWSNPLISLQSLVLSSNSAANAAGGGIFQTSGTLSLKNNAKIKLNSATQGGGAYLSGTTATMNGGLVKGNTASTNGGGLLSSDGNLSLTGVSVVSNQVASGSTLAGYGGGLYQNNGGTLRISGGTIVQGNSAQDGGGVLCDSSVFFDVSSTIKGNTATSVGGGFCSLANSQAMNFTNANVSSNTVAASGAGSGGGLYVSGGTLNANVLSVKNNKIQAANNQTMEGGGLYASNTAVNLKGGTAATTTFSGNTLTGNGSGTAYGGALFLTNGSGLSAQSNLAVANNIITNTASGVGGGIAFFANTSFSAGDSYTSSGNSASAGGNDYAFVVTDTSDNNNTTSENGPSGINYFTSGTGSLRSAISYSQNWMNGNANNHSMAIILSPSASYGLSSSYGQLAVNAPGGTTLTLIGENGTSTSQATINASGNGNRGFYVGGSGSVVLQNLVVTGGRATQEYYDSNNAAGGGIFLDGATLTLNNTAVQGNLAIATIAGTNGASGSNYGHSGHAGASGRSAYGGGIYMNQGTLNFLSSSSITGNTVQGSAGGNGGKGGSGRTHGASTFDCDYTNGGRGGNGGNGGNALGGGLYQANGTLNAPSSSLNISGNIETPGGAGLGGGGGQSGENEGIECGWGTSGYGTNGSAGSNGNGQGYYIAGGGQTYSSSAVVGALSVDTSSGVHGAGSSRNSGLKKLPGVILELHSADGRLIATTRSDANGSFGFSVPFNGEGYIQVQRLATYAIAPRGTRIAPGIASSFDPRTLRTPVMRFLDGTAMNQKTVLVMTPIHTVIQTGPNFIRLANADTNSVLWSKSLKSPAYHGGFTYAPVDLNGDSTHDYVVLLRSGPAKPFLVDGLTGAVTPISGTVSANLARGFAVEMTRLLGDGRRQLVLYPSNDRSGQVSVIDLSSRSVLWSSSGTVRGGMTVKIASSFLGNGISPADVVLTSKTLDVKTDGHNWQIWLDGSTGRTIRVLDLYPRTPQSVHLIDVPASDLAQAKPLHARAAAALSLSASSQPPAASKHVNVSRAMILRRQLRPS